LLALPIDSDVFGDTCAFRLTNGDTHEAATIATHRCFNIRNVFT
jgi:hypothetical protein